MKNIRVDLDVYNYLVSKGLGSGESVSSILRRELARTIAIDDDVYDFIVSLAQEVGESASSILRRSLDLTPTLPVPQPGPTGVIEFRIKAGTQAGPWNTRPEMILAVVGQTLRLFNDDTVLHQPHTPGEPFPHAAMPIPPGTFADFVLTKELDPSQAPHSPVYDHLWGETAQFWIKVASA